MQISCKHSADDSEADKKPEEGGKSAEELEGSPKNGSKNIDEMSEFLTAKHIIRSIHEATTKAVETYNKRGKEFARGKK